jgi:hypothetical protein
MGRAMRSYAVLYSANISYLCQKRFYPSANSVLRATQSSTLVILNEVKNLKMSVTFLLAVKMVRLIDF